MDLIWHPFIYWVLLAIILASVHVSSANVTTSKSNILSLILTSNRTHLPLTQLPQNLEYSNTNNNSNQNINSSQISTQVTFGKLSTKGYSNSPPSNTAKVLLNTKGPVSSLSLTQNSVATILAKTATNTQKTSDLTTFPSNGNSNPKLTATTTTATAANIVATTTTSANIVSTTTTTNTTSGNSSIGTIIIRNNVNLITFNVGHTSVLLYITCSTLAAVFLAIMFHHLHRISMYIPESCFLLLVGIAFGCVVRFTVLDEIIPETFSPSIFFLVLLPPVILGASYSLNDRVFYENLGVVLLFAVVGTASACFIIGPLLYGLSQTPALILPNQHLVTQIFLFSSLIVAVDPVAVLAVFSELGVNKPLHIVVFGESLLNDGVSVVLYRVMANFHRMPEITGKDIGLGFLKFVISAGVSSMMGLLIGIFSTVACKYTYVKHVLEPVILVMTAYLSYILAETFELSGIICMIVCGLIQAQYAFHNINPKSRTNLKFIIKTVGLAAELVIFIFLGISVARTRHQWNAGFIIWSLVACILSRTLITIVFSYFVNKFHGERMKIFSLKEQLVMSFGGLRGGVAFSLALQLSEKEVTLRGMFLTTVLMIILFNVVIQGIAIRPLINLLKVQREEKAKKNLLSTINHQLTDNMLQLIEKISGHSGKNVWRKKLEKFELAYIQRCLLKEPHPTVLKIGHVNTKVAIRNVYSSMSSLTVPMPADDRGHGGRYISREPSQFELTVKSDRPGNSSVGKELDANQLLQYVRSDKNSENSPTKEIKFYVGDSDTKCQQNGQRNGASYRGESLEDFSDGCEVMSRL